MMVEDYRTPLLGQKDIKYVSNGNHTVDIEEQEGNDISRLYGNGIKKLQASRKEDGQVAVEILPEQVEHHKELEGSFHRFKQLSSSLGKIPEIEALSPVDPFRNNTHDVEGFYGWAKLVLLFPLLIIRVVLAAILLAVGYVITKIGLVGYKQSENPMPKWRRRLISVDRLCARGLLFCYGFQWIRRIGKPAPREVAPIVVSNHVSFIDPMFFFYELFPTIVSSQSHDDIFGVGAIVRAMQVILVDRSSAESRKMAIDEIKRRAGCNEFPRILLFPEGTTTNGRAIISFRSGAFVPGVPIQPVVVRYPHIHFDPSWGNISLPRLLLRMLTQIHNFMEVEYLPVVFPSEREQRHPPLYSEMVRYNMARTLNVPETQHNHGDLMLAVRASELKLQPPGSSFMVEMGKIKRHFDLTLPEVMEYLEQFANLFHSCSVTKHQFLESLELPKGSVFEQIFELLDIYNQGSIRFFEFVVVAAFILRSPASEALVRSAFEACDTNNVGSVSGTEVAKRLQVSIPSMSDEMVQKLTKNLSLGHNDAKGISEFRHFMLRNPVVLLMLSAGSGQIF